MPPAASLNVAPLGFPQPSRTLVSEDCGRSENRSAETTCAVLRCSMIPQSRAFSSLQGQKGLNHALPLLLGTNRPARAQPQRYPPLLVPVLQQDIL